MRKPLFIVLLLLGFAGAAFAGRVGQDEKPNVWVTADSNIEIVRVDACKYIIAHEVHNMRFRANAVSIIHAGDCPNPAHKGS